MIEQEDDRVYLQRRAYQERRRAAECEDNVVAAIHLDLADAYEQRLEMPDRPAARPHLVSSRAA